MDPARILFIRLTALGDVVLATPALRALRRRFPQARIDWLVDAAYVPLLEKNPHLTHLVPYDRRGEHAGGAGLLRLRAQLRRQRYDLVVDLQRKPKTVALARGLGAARVVALQKRTKAELLRAMVGLQRPQVKAHAIQMYLDALSPLQVAGDELGLEVPLAPTARLSAERVCGAGEDRRFVAIAPGARWATKRWLPERFGAVARALHQAGHPLLLLGGPTDAEALAAVRAAVGAELPDTASLGVDGLVGALARCKLLVACDSGPLHLASALQVPAVALYGPTAPRRWAPRAGAVTVIHKGLVCSPCSNHGSARCPIGTHQCMKEISAEEVVAAALALLDAQPPRATLAR